MIRPATLDDVAPLVELGQRFLAESSYAGKLTENPEKMAETATRLIAQPDGAVFVSVDQDGCVNGTIGLLLFAHHFSGDLTVGECFFFVNPASRGSIGVRLIRAAKAWAIDQQATSMQVVAPEGASRVEQLYTALDFLPLERAFVMAL